MASATDIIQHLKFKGLHPFRIQVAGTGDEIFLVGIFPCQGISNEMAAVVEVISFHQFMIINQLPTAGMNFPDGAPLLTGHSLGTYVSISCSAPSQGIQLAVLFKHFRRKIFLSERGAIPV